MKQDIQRKLSVDMGFPSDTVTTIVAHIFGQKNGPTFFEGLVDTNSEDEFDSKLQSLEEIWANFEDLRAKKSNNRITFYAWFCKYHAEEIKSTMIRSVREAAGLGDPPSEFCTNDSEAINSALKQFLAFKKSDWPIFNEKMRKFVSSQEEEVCKSIIGLGQYSLKEEYQHLSVAPSRWFTSLSDDQKKDAQRKFQRQWMTDRIFHQCRIFYQWMTDRKFHQWMTESNLYQWMIERIFPLNPLTIFQMTICRTVT